jgi:hypothetical protein
VRIDFDITSWAAWAPGLTDQAAWKTWAAGDALPPRGAETPPLTEVPPMARRRVDKMGRLAFQVAAWCQGETRGQPLVFASRRGDTVRSLELLEMLQRGEALSPTAFALSVHNAVGAQYSIVRGDGANVSAVANGVFTLEAAVTEAVTLLAEAPAVTLVAYDVAPPAIFAPYLDEPEADFAFAWTVSRGASLSLETAAPVAHVATLPHALEVLRFFLRGDASLTLGDDATAWRWARHG